MPAQTQGRRASYQVLDLQLPDSLGPRQGFDLRALKDDLRTDRKSVV